MSAARLATVAGLTVLAAVSVWLLPETGAGFGPAGLAGDGLAEHLLRTILVAQCLAIALLAPLARGRGALGASLLPALIPTPLVALGWLAGAGTALVLVAVQGVLLLCAAALAGVALLLRTRIAQPWAGLAPAALQLAAAALAWRTHELWLGVATA